MSGGRGPASGVRGCGQGKGAGVHVAVVHAQPMCLAGQRHLGVQSVAAWQEVNVDFGAIDGDIVLGRGGGGRAMERSHPICHLWPARGGTNPKPHGCQRRATRPH